MIAKRGWSFRRQTIVYRVLEVAWCLLLGGFFLWALGGAPLP